MYTDLYDENFVTIRQLERFLQNTTDAYRKFNSSDNNLDENEYVIDFNVNNSIITYVVTLIDKYHLKQYCNCGCNDSFLTAIYNHKLGYFFPITYSCISSPLVSPLTILKVRYLKFKSENNIR